MPFSQARRGFLTWTARAASIALVTTALAGTASAPSIAAPEQAITASAQKIADHFANIKTMAGEFVQFGPNGEQTGGKFYIERPGRLRFDYNTKNNFKVIADGRSVAVSNIRMKTYNIYPLSKTPLKLLLGNRIDLSSNEVKDILQSPDATTIKFADKSVFGDSRLTMIFDPKTYALKQWTATDAQGKDTTVMIFNVQEGVKIDPSLFKIDYASAEVKQPLR
ncbi:MAG: outer membrane lipoprotein carrier protein LolA [Hyphomicrobiales bacterium]|nr:outer membrane lipoprotein carrier protein LolA [Hyphomicrobiales bacterium]